MHNYHADTSRDRLRAVSLLLENPRGKEAENKSRASGEATGSVRGGRRAKRETAMVSYNDCETRHSGDGVILLVDDDAHLSAIFIGDIRGEFEQYLPTGFDNQICQTQLASRLSIQRIL